MSSTTLVRRVALITGAARGIGAAAVRQFVDDGYNVVAIDWCADTQPDLVYKQATREDLATLVRDLPDGRVIPYVADVRSAEELQAAAALALRTWGRIDAAVAAAAVLQGGGKPVWQDNNLQLMWEINVQGVWNTIAATVPAMLAGPDPAGCRFVAIASAAGERGLYNLANYSAVKHAVVGLVRGLAADLVGTGVTAAIVSPGSTDTALLSATAKTYGVTTEELAEHQLLRRLLDADEVARVVRFACSRDGAVLTGSIINADGGFGA
ncbi:mycofactocin-coupled SDR family oxidoreductase [Burkholderia sp. Ax-1719]|uniref:mycofactocin-coupled SDR family oxidoreductase n=1 Tax=Burkholderia sp. Ax-1719 TaxID=2608334 RepID=UPI0014205F9A|nr:mycofactocin-coupled SDR family oxidoreductase [Burkholderia sp. Ax-1719]NIE66897.1 SDR family oxidoreductase [Burkholderia sp. Ax-1719]